jgi:hypothetical protein
MYTFRSGDSGAVRHLEISIRRRGTGLRIVALHGSALRSGGASLAYTLSSSAEVSIRVLNAAGRVMDLPIRDDLQTAGPHTLSWDGRTQAGARVPAGMYLVEMEARNEMGELTRATARVMLGR